MKLSSKISPFIQRLQQAPAGYWFEPEERSDPINVLAPRMGSYFCYGTLMDPALLSEILSLPEIPTLRPAKLVGYSLKLWGQYPALINGPPGAVIEGMVYEVEHGEHAQRLAKYETQVYSPVPCLIRFIDGKEPEEVTGTTFKYVGNPMHLKEGAFDLGVWLKGWEELGQRTKAS